MKNIIKTNISGYVKDVRNGMIYNTNYHELIAYRESILKSKKINMLENKIEKLSNEFSEILNKLNKA